MKRPSTGSRAAPAREKKRVAFEFVLDELAGLNVRTRAMFGATAVYLGDKMLLFLRERETFPEDNGVWIATTAEHHASLREEFPSMRSIGLFGRGETDTQNLPADAPDFESSALRVCELILRGDPRIGRLPASKQPRKAKASTSAKAKPRRSR